MCHSQDYLNFDRYLIAVQNLIKNNTNCFVLHLVKVKQYNNCFIYSNWNPYNTVQKWKNNMSFKESVKGVENDEDSEKHARIQTEVFLSLIFIQET